MALSTKLFGDTQFALELPFLLMSAGATALIWRIGTRFLTAAQAVIAALIFWVWPAVFVWIGVKGLIFYVPTMVLGLSMILCAQRAVEKKTQFVDWGAAGLFAGHGVVDVAQRVVLPRAARHLAARVPLARAVAAALAWWRCRSRSSARCRGSGTTSSTASTRSRSTPVSRTGATSTI